MYKSAVYVGILCLMFVVTSYGAEVYTSNCTRTVAETKPLSIVHSIDISPCDQAPDGPCTITRGQNITVNITLTTKTKIGKKVKHGYFWESAVDIPFKGINLNPCIDFMSCPVKKNTRMTYSGVIPTKRTFPPSTYPTKIKIFQGKKIIFCKVVRIRLV